MRAFVRHGHRQRNREVVQLAASPASSIRLIQPKSVLGPAPPVARLPYGRIAPRPQAEAVCAHLQRAPQNLTRRHSSALIQGDASASNQ